MWELTRDDTSYGFPKRRLRGHSHFVSDVVMSSDGQFALSGSWDHTLRLWDLQTCVQLFKFFSSKFSRFCCLQWKNCAAQLNVMSSVLQRWNNSTFCWSHQGCAECCVFRRQQTNRVWLQGQDCKALEYPGGLQIHHPSEFVTNLVISPCVVNLSAYMFSY